MGKTTFKRILRSAEKKDAPAGRGVVGRGDAASEHGRVGVPAAGRGGVGRGDAAAEQEGPRGSSPGLKPWEGDLTYPSNKATAGESAGAPAAAEPSPDAVRPKGSGPVPDVAAPLADGARTGQSGLTSGLIPRAAAVDGARDSPAAVFTDKSVCRYLGIRRRVLAEARTASSRGRDWEAVGEEVGMTLAWIDGYAVKHGIMPSPGPLERVSGKYVSARLVGTTPNLCVCIVQLEATDRRAFARVRNLMSHPIHYRKVFDCVRVDDAGGGRLEWIAGPNDVKY